MEQFKLTQKGVELYVEGLPDAVRVVRICGPHAKRLADLALHKADLDFAEVCLASINAMPAEPYILREALWRSAVIHVLKCFGKSEARTQLSAKKVFRSEPPEAMEVYRYFLDLRHKHLIHDENSYAQSNVGAALNRGDKDYKIEKVLCVATIAVSLEQESYGNLSTLIRKTQAWVGAEIDNLCARLAADLESEPYEKLAAMDEIRCKLPRGEDIGRTRSNA